MEIGARRRQVRGAIWLWVQLAMYAPETEDEWWLVANGDQISDERLGVYLDVSAARAKKWRERLQQLELIRTEPVRPLNWKFWVRNPDKVDQQQTVDRAAMTISKLVH
jgi:hypothetical protein